VHPRGVHPLPSPGDVARAVFYHDITESVFGTADAAVRETTAARLCLTCTENPFG